MTAPEQATILRRRIAALEQRLAALLDSGTAQPRQLGSRQTNRLTDRKVKTLSEPGFYADGGNLYLDFRGPPAKNWVVRWKRDGRAHDLGLGPYPLVGLAEARAAAIAVRRQLRGGLDPLAARKARQLARRIEHAKVTTFQYCAETYIAGQADGWKNDWTRRNWLASLTAYAFPMFGELPVETVDTALVLKALQPIWATKPVMASQLRGRLENILDWATVRGYREGPNPAHWKGHLAKLLPKTSKVHTVAHREALPYNELPAFMAGWLHRDGLTALALCFTILTCMRTGEVVGAEWKEFDLPARLWVVPAGRMKMEREHRVPLSAPVLEILATLKQLPPSPFVFPGKPGQPMANGTMMAALRRSKCGGLTVHGFRSTFSDWCAERTHFAGELREMCLAHAVNDQTEAAYRRGDMFEKRRRVMDAWARYCTTPLAAGEVAPMIALTA